MLINRGEVLKEQLHKFSNATGVSLTRISKQAGYDQSTMYRHFAKPDLSDHIILKYGRVVDIDFSKLIPDMKEINMVVMEEKGAYSNNDEVSVKVAYWRDKYIDLLEKHNKMLIDRLDDQ
ncbi:MAG: hypothetical protein ABJH57_20670 [Cyclobacteriaceae bacterium]